jgi:hypothetical protein
MVGNEWPLDRLFSRDAIASYRAGAERERAVGSGQWAVGSGQWAVGSGQWAVGSGQWAVGSDETKLSITVYSTSAGSF